MRWTSVLAIMLLFWVMSAFLVLPFNLRTHDEAGSEQVPGQISSAPVNFNPRRVAKRATLLAVLLFGLYYLNYVNDWIDANAVDFTRFFPGAPPHDKGG